MNQSDVTPKPPKCVTSGLRRGQHIIRSHLDPSSHTQSTHSYISLLKRQIAKGELLEEMNPLSLVASVIACIQAADRIVSLCKDYVEMVKGARSDLQVILIEVASMRGVLEELKIMSHDSQCDLWRR